MSAIFGKEGYRFIEINAVKTIFGLSILLPLVILFKIPIQELVSQKTSILLVVVLLLLSRLIGSLVIEITQESVFLPLLKDIFSSTIEKEGYTGRVELRRFPPHKMWKDELFKRAREEIIILVSLLVSLIILFATFNIANYTPFYLEIPEFIKWDSRMEDNSEYNDLIIGLKGYIFWINLVLSIFALPVVYLLYRTVFTSYIEENDPSSSIAKENESSSLLRKIWGNTANILSFCRRHNPVFILPIILLLIDYSFYKWLLNLGVSNKRWYFAIIYVGFILIGIILYLKFLRSYSIMRNFEHRKKDMKNVESDWKSRIKDITSYCIMFYVTFLLVLLLVGDIDYNLLDLRISNEKGWFVFIYVGFIWIGIILYVIYFIFYSIKKYYEQRKRKKENTSPVNDRKREEENISPVNDRKREEENISPVNDRKNRIEDFKLYSSGGYVIVLLILFLVDYLFYKWLLNLDVSNEEKWFVLIYIIGILIGTIQYFVYPKIYSNEGNTKHTEGEKDMKNEINDKESHVESFISYISIGYVIFLLVLLLVGDMDYELLNLDISDEKWWFVLIYIGVIVNVAITPYLVCLIINSIKKHFEQRKRKKRDTKIVSTSKSHRDNVKSYSNKGGAIVLLILFHLLVDFLFYKYFLVGDVLNKELWFVLIYIRVILIGAIFVYLRSNVIKKNFRHREGEKEDIDTVKNTIDLQEDLRTYYSMYYDLLNYKTKNIKLESQLLLISSIHAFNLLSSTYVYDLQEKEFSRKGKSTVYTVATKISDIPSYTIAIRLLKDTTDSVIKNNFDTAISFFLSSLRHAATHLILKSKNVELIIHIFKNSKEWNSELLLSNLEGLNDRIKSNSGDLKFLEEIKNEVKEEILKINNIKQSEEEEKRVKEISYDLLDTILGKSNKISSNEVDGGFLNTVLQVIEKRRGTTSQKKVMLVCSTFHQLFVKN